VRETGLYVELKLGGRSILSAKASICFAKPMFLRLPNIFNRISLVMLRQDGFCARF
jgi:hypothetical protein